MPGNVFNLGTPGAECGKAARLRYCGEMEPKPCFHPDNLCGPPGHPPSNPLMEGAIEKRFDAGEWTAREYKCQGIYAIRAPPFPRVSARQGNENE